MGRIRTRFIKHAAEEVVEKYSNELTLDYLKNKEILEEVLVVSGTTVRNRIVGYVTTLMKKEERLKIA